MDLVFEWDRRKDRANLEKHSISFSEATSVFGDPLTRIFADEDHPTTRTARSSSAIRERDGSSWYVSLSSKSTGSGSSVHGVQPEGSGTIMKSTSRPKAKTRRSNELRPEYRFDYAKAKPNRFVDLVRPGSVAILLDPDVARVFHTGESVNAVLRALLSAIPARGHRTGHETD